MSQNNLSSHKLTASDISYSIRKLKNTAEVANAVSCLKDDHLQGHLGPVCPPPWNWPFIFLRVYSSVPKVDFLVSSAFLALILSSFLFFSLFYIISHFLYMKISFTKCLYCHNNWYFPTNMSCRAWTAESDGLVWNFPTVHLSLVQMLKPPISHQSYRHVQDDSFSELWGLNGIKHTCRILNTGYIW